MIAITAVLLLMNEDRFCLVYIFLVSDICEFSFRFPLRILGIPTNYNYDYVVRTYIVGTLHGVSAFLGKVGALLATIIFGQVSIETIFLICGIVGLLGAVLTLLFSVDMTHVSLSEHDAQLGKYRMVTIVGCGSYLSLFCCSPSE